MQRQQVDGRAFPPSRQGQLHALLPEQQEGERNGYRARGSRADQPHDDRQQEGHRANQQQGDQVVRTKQLECRWDRHRLLRQDRAAT
jgi:hypothetical protein